jgi:hypothetical protein
MVVSPPERGRSKYASGAYEGCLLDLSWRSVQRVSMAGGRAYKDFRRDMSCVNLQVIRLLYAVSYISISDQLSNLYIPHIQPDRTADALDNSDDKGRGNMDALSSSSAWSGGTSPGGMSMSGERKRLQIHPIVHMQSHSPGSGIGSLTTLDSSSWMASRAFKARSDMC